MEEKKELPRGRFVKGDPRAGRPKGARDKAKRTTKALCLSLIEDPVYIKKLTKRLHAGKLSPAVETMLWYYAVGKPAERVEVRHLNLERIHELSEQDLERVASGDFSPIAIN